MKTLLLNILSVIVIIGMGLLPANGIAGDPASAYGKYRNLLQELSCPSDQSTYGEYRDYGYWGGGPWCGYKGKAGYWVWVYPNWYVWANKGIPAAAAAHGKYTNLLQTLKCPRDRRKYGKFTDFGYWRGGTWCGQSGRGGYWVWVAPNWYVWGTKN